MYQGAHPLSGLKKVKGLRLTTKMKISCFLTPNLDLLEAVDPEVLKMLQEQGDDDVITADDTLAALDDLENDHEDDSDADLDNDLDDLEGI